MPASTIFQSKERCFSCAVGSFATLSADQRCQLASLGFEFFTTLEWFELLSATALDPDCVLRLYILETASTATVSMACLPMIHRTQERKRCLSALANFYSPIFSPLVTPTQLFELTDSFARKVAIEKPRWDIIDLQPIDPESPFFVALLKDLRQENFIVDTYLSHSNWYLEVAGRSFAEYFESLPPILRNTLGRARNRLNRYCQFSIKILCEDSGDLEKLIQAYESVYARSWKRPEPYPQFIPELCRLAAKKKILRLGILELEGVPVAAEIWLVFNGVASIFKLAYDQHYAKLSVGSVLTAVMMEHAIDVDRVHLVDYLTGNEPYKKLWMSHRQERYGIVAFNPFTLHGLARAIRHYGGKILTQLRQPHRNHHSRK